MIGKKKILLPTLKKFSLMGNGERDKNGLSA